LRRATPIETFADLAELHDEMAEPIGVLPKIRRGYPTRFGRGQRGPNFWFSASTADGAAWSGSIDCSA
jgi:hypothetical protein